METDQLKNYLKSLEQKLLLRETRKNPHELEKIIADKFFEIGSSGKIWNKKTVIEALNNEPQTDISMTDFRFTLLSENVALINYTSHHKQNNDNPSFKSLRTSVWKKFNGNWKIIFHQGTPVK